MRNIATVRLFFSPTLTERCALRKPLTSRRGVVYAAFVPLEVTEIGEIVICLLLGVDVKFTASAATSDLVIHAANTPDLPSSGAV